MVQNDFFPGKSRLRAFTQLKQDKINRCIFPVPHQTQPLGFQSVFGGGDDQLCQPFRFMHQEKVSAELQKMAAAAE